MQEPYPLEDRTLKFSAGVIRHCARLQQPALTTIVNQVIRSATSIGANYAEANNAASRADFKAKIFIAKKEAAETKYWLSLLTELGDTSDELIALRKEIQEIIMILQKIITTLRVGKHEN